jgi:hypothetical protein
MTDRPESWSCHHFSLSNAAGSGQSDLPKLLRRVATAIEQRDIRPMDVMDITLSSEMTAEGPWWSATVYWSPQDTRA